MENLLEKEIPKGYTANDGMVGIVYSFVAILVAAILVVSVVIPTINTALNDATNNITGTTRTILNIVPLLLGVVLVLLVVGMVQ